MLEIQVPLWLLLSAAGLAVLSIAWLFQRERRMRSKEAWTANEPPGPAAQPEPFGLHIHRQLLDQHIDCVFTALASVLDTERIKLKTLALHSWPEPEKSQRDQGLKLEGSSQALKTNVLSTGENVPAPPTQGEVPDRIVDQSNLCEAELLLARKMKEGRSRAGRKIQAVA